MMKHLLLYFCLACFFLLALSCKKDGLKSPTASFLVVDNLTLKTNPSIQGANSHKILDIWYYVDGQFKGVFPVGNVMPIVAENNAQITLFAGIKNNGITATRIPYPAYDSKSYNLSIEAGKTYTLSPEFEYNSTTYFYYSDGFDSSGSYFQSTGDSNYVVTYDPNKTFGGVGGSLFMSMGNSKPTARMVQTNGYYLPAGGATIYVELNYKCNQPITLGVMGGDDVNGYNDKRGAIIINPSDEWNKIYVQLTKVVSTAPTYPKYKVYIEATQEVATPEIYIDNVKLIYQ